MPYIHVPQNSVCKNCIITLGITSTGANFSVPNKIPHKRSVVGYLALTHRYIGNAVVGDHRQAQKRWTSNLKVVFSFKTHAPEWVQRVA